MKKKRKHIRRGKRPEFDLIRDATMNDLLDRLKAGTIWRYNMLAESGNPWMVVQKDAEPDLDTTNGSLPSAKVWVRMPEAKHDCQLRVIEGKDIVIQR